MEEGIDRRLAALERRIGELEARLASGQAGGGATPGSIEPKMHSTPAVSPELKPETVPELVPFAALAPQPAQAGPPPLPKIVPPFPEKVLTPEAIAARVASDRYADNMRSAYDGDPPTPAPRALPVAGKPPLARPVPMPWPSSKAATGANPASSSLEQTIGLQWAGWIGAIVLVIGTGLGFKYAYDQGWLGGLPPAAKLLVMTLIGFGLIGVGEYVYRTINRMSAAGLYGAGIAVLFLCAYASHGWYGLFTPTVALAMMGAVGLIGLLISARSDLVSVAVLAIVGANLAPIILGGKLHNPAPFLAYVACLQLMALALCALRAEPKWWSLRTLTLITTFFWMTGTTVAPESVNYRYTLLAFAAFFWAAFQIELLTTLPRAATAGKIGIAQRSGGVAYSLFTTAALALWILIIYDKASAETKGHWLLAIAILVGAMGIALARVRDGVLAPLARGYRVQSVLLLVLTIPVLLHGPTMLIAWMLLAVGLALHGARNQNRLAFAGAIGVWGLAVTCWAAESIPGMNKTWLTLFGQAISEWVCLAAALMVSGHLIAACLHRFARTREVATPRLATSRADGIGYVMDLAAAGVLAMALMQATPKPFATWTLIIYAWALLGVGIVAALPEMAAVALVVLSGTAVKWLTIDTLIPRMSIRGPVPMGRLFFNKEAAAGYVLAGSMGVMAWLVGRLRDRDGRSREKTDSLLAMSFTLTMIFLGVVFSTQIAGTTIADNFDSATASLHRNLLLTIVWSACTFAWVMTLRQAIVTVALRQKIEGIALGAALLLAGKFVLFDVIGSYVDARPTMPIGLNIQVLTAFIVGVLVVLTAVLAKTSTWRGLAIFAVVGLLLVVGSAEIDRYAVMQNNGPVWIVRQVGWSIYWSMLAVVALVVGFAGKLESLRYLALGLLALTLLKVVLVDMSGAGTGWRILSFLGLGVLLLATSVLYGKFGRKLPPKATV